MQQPVVLPPEVQNLAQTYQLGPQISEHKVTIKVWNIVVGGLITLFAVFIIIANLNAKDPTGGMLLGGLFLLLGLAALLTPVFFFGNKVFFFQQGAVAIQKGKVETIRWDQVEYYKRQVVKRYYRGIPVGTFHKHTLRRRDGVEVKFDGSYSKINELGDILNRETTRVLFPLVMQAIDQGQTVNFGSIALNNQGVTHYGEGLPWGELERLEVNNGNASFKRTGKFFHWGTQAVHDIPNFGVYYQVVATILTRMGRPQYV